jgi:hypothetical protein
LKIIKSAILFSMTVGLLAATEHSSDFLNQGFGARSAALGNAYGVAVEDPSALYWNPAGLAGIRSLKFRSRTVRKQKQSTGKKYVKEDEELNKLLGQYSNTAPVQSEALESDYEVPERESQTQIHTSSGFLPSGNLKYLGSAGTSIGSGAIAAGFGGSRRIKVSDNAASVMSSLSEPNVDIAYLGYGWGREHFRWGISLFGLREESVNGDIHGGGANLGIQYAIPFFPETVSFSGEIRNLGGVEARPKVGLHDLRKLDTLMSYAMKINLGFLTNTPGFSLLLGVTANLDDPNGKGAKLNSGFTYAFNRDFSVMVGLNDSNPSAGFGLNAGNFLRFALAARRDAQKRDFEYFAEMQVIF